MAIIRKESFIKDICTRVMRGAVHFSKEDRPVMERGGVRTGIGSVSFDQDLGQMICSLVDGDGLSAGIRRLESLDPGTLSALVTKVSEAVRLRMSGKVSMERTAARERPLAKGMSL